MKALNFKGSFKILDYRMSHKLLLLRASKRKGDTLSNIDILFRGVFYLEIPERLEDIVIRKAIQEEVDYVCNRCYYNVFLQYSEIFVLECANSKYFIGAGDFQVSENQLPPLESSIKT